MSDAAEKHSCFIKSGETAASLRVDNIIALLPAAAWSVFVHGMSALLLIFTSVLTAALTDFLCTLFASGKAASPSPYGIWCGLLFSLFLFDGTSLLISAAGGALSVLISAVMGGEGRCLFFSPAAAYAVIYMSFPELFGVPGDTPVSLLYGGGSPDTELFDFMIGNFDGSIAAAALPVFFGALYLIIRRSGSFSAPAAYMATAALLYFIFPAAEGRADESVIFGLFSGSLVFCAVYILSDSSVLPITSAGKVLFGVGCGALTFVFRKYGDVAASELYSVLIMGIFTVFIDRLSFAYLKKRYGER